MVLPSCWKLKAIRNENINFWGQMWQLFVLYFAQITLFYDCPFKSTRCTSSPVFVGVGSLWTPPRGMKLMTPNFKDIVRRHGRLHISKICLKGRLIADLEFLASPCSLLRRLTMASVAVGRIISKQVESCLDSLVKNMVKRLRGFGYTTVTWSST